jgi:hypothetical protein
VGLLLACLIGAAVVQFRHTAHFDPHIVWDGFTLPGFDAHVYVAMAEEPRVFTVGPWGYRILLPALLGSLLPPRWIVPGFDWAARISLVAASGLLFIHLRVLGATMRAALLAVLAVMVTAPVDRVFANPFLVEPFALVFLLLALIAIEGRARAAWIALSLLLLSLSKEIWVALLPLAFLGEKTRGPRHAALRTLQVAAPALCFGLVMRLMWRSQSEAIQGGAEPLAVLATILTSLPGVASDYLLGGLTLAAILALREPGARDYLRRNAFTLTPLLFLPLLAATYTGEGTADNFFADDVTRLLIYVLPFAAALAVQLDPAHRPRWRFDTGSASARVAVFLAVLIVVAPLSLDRYSRLDFKTSRDGPYLLGTVRETLRIARRLDRGDEVVFDPAERKFAWGVSPPSELSKLRFFLRKGFGPLAHYGIHDIRMRETAATLIVPVLKPGPVKVTLTMDARTSTWVAFFARGVKVGEALIGPQAVSVTVEIPSSALFRGDNPVELRCDDAAAAQPRILRIKLIQPTKP